MELLAEWGLANALTVLALAPLAALVAKASRRPAWAHAAWLLVLLKLVTPPIVGLPILPRWEDRARPAAIALPAAPIEDREAILRAELRGLVAEARALAPAPAPTRPAFAISWRVGLVSAWLAGSAAWVILAAWRIARFARVLARSGPAPEALADRVQALSERIGLRRPPIVAFVPGRLSPMVWSLGGRARLVVPEALWGRLDDAQRSAVLVHELAHLRRGDHRARLLETLATGLYWWHPALWWARRGLHRAEESCCDLWVTWALPEAKKRYATALVEAMDFLSEDRSRPLPACASGMGQVEDLSRRIGMIMRSDAPRGLSRAGALATFGIGAFLLPWHPSWARQDPAPTPTATVEAAKVDNPIAPRLEGAAAAVPRSSERSIEVGKLEAQIDNARKTLQVYELEGRNLETDPDVKRARKDLARLEAQYDLMLWKESSAEAREKLGLKLRAQEARKPGDVIREDGSGADDEAAIREAFLALPRVASIRDEIEQEERAYENAKRRLRGNLNVPTLRTLREKMSFLRSEHDDLWETIYPKLKGQMAGARDDEARHLQVALAEQIARDVRGEPTTDAVNLDLDLKKAQDKLTWSEKMREQKYVSESQVRAFEAEVMRAKSAIASARLGRQRAALDAKDQAELARGRVAVKKAGVQKAEAQLRLAKVELARIASLQKSGEGFVSSTEVAKAEAEVSIADAEVERAGAEAEQEEKAARQAERRAEELGREADADKARPGAAVDAAQDGFRSGADPNRRIEELEAKMDRILKELQAIRDEKAAKPRED